MSHPVPACWQAENARAIFVTEALEGNDAIFLATHTPIEGFEVGGRDAGEFGGTTEHAVLTTLSDPTRRHAFCVVQGEPGSGKSHLIRWLSVNWSGERDIRLLLRRADGSLEGALRQLKERLPSEFLSLFDNIGERQRASQQGRANIFLNTLAATLKPGHFEIPLDDDGWCQQYAPSELLTHPTIQSNWTSPSRILNLLEGSGGGRNSATASFDLYDIEALANLCGPLIGQASIAHAQTLARRLRSEVDTIRAYREQEWLPDELVAEHPGYFETSLRLIDALNRRRNDAIQNVLGVSAQRLKNLFKEVREALYERNQRLVLFLEDITSWEGLDDSLIDVLVFNAAATGDADARNVCPLISVVGVTPAYYDKLAANYKQRITHEIRLGHSSGGLQDVATLRDADNRRRFAARYLAAVRVGPAALNGWLALVQSGDTIEPPNLCDSCPRQRACFDVFGEEGGIGLFPFTAHAFGRFFDALKDNDNGQTWKTPRGILQAILNPNLIQPDTLAAGTYPGPFIEPDAFRSDRRSSLALSNRLEKIVINQITEPQVQARMGRVLTYWADPDRADTTMQDGELAFAGARRSLFEAFGLRWLGMSDVSADAPAKPTTATVMVPVHTDPEKDEPSGIANGPPRTPTTANKPVRPLLIAPKPKRLIPTKSQLEQHREQIRVWGTTGTIENASYWNTLLHELISAIDTRKFNVPMFLTNKLITPDMVKLQGSTSGARDYLTISAEAWARNGLEAYLALRHPDARLSVADASFHRHNLANMMRQLERRVLDYLDRRTPRLADGKRWSPVVTFTQILLARAWLRGTVSANEAIPDQIRAVLDDEGTSGSDYSARSSPWQDWLNATSKAHEPLRIGLRSMVGLALGEGEGGSPLTDASELAGAVVRFRETGKFDVVPETDGGLPEPFKRSRELAEQWSDKRYLIERTETSQINNRSESLSNLLRNKSVATHMERLDNCITGIATQLPQASADRVTAWRQAHARLKQKLEDGAGNRTENLICAIEAEEIPTKLPLRLCWLARVPARDLADILETAQLGEKCVETLRDHARDCVEEAGGTASLSQVKVVGRALRSVVGDQPQDEAPA